MLIFIWFLVPFLDLEKMMKLGMVDDSSKSRIRQVHCGREYKHKQVRVVVLPQLLPPSAAAYRCRLQQLIRVDQQQQLLQPPLPPSPALARPRTGRSLFKYRHPSQRVSVASSHHEWESKLSRASSRISKLFGKKGKDTTSESVHSTPAAPQAPSGVKRATSLMAKRVTKPLT